LSSQSDELQRSLDFIIEKAERLLDRPFDGSLTSDDEDWEGRCEVIETVESVLVIIDISGIGVLDIDIALGEDELTVSVPGTETRLKLPCRISPSPIRRENRNGVLSMDFAKA
jgi:HSP20 family molecular chaperone IbpA